MKLKKFSISLWFFLGALVIVSILLFFHFRGITYYDEGYILNAALRIAHGQIPYRDFDMVYTPLSFVITAGFLVAFGESVFSARIAALVISFFSVVALFLLLKHFTTKGWLIFISLLFFVSWGSTHINFTWPTMFAICFFLYAALFFIKGIERQSYAFLFIAGVMTVLTFLSKQNFGTGVFLVFLLSFLFLQVKTKTNVFLHYLSGVFVAYGVFVLVLFLTASGQQFIQNMYLYTFKRVLLDKALNTPFLYEGPLIIRVAKFFLYLSPLIIAIAAFLVVFKKHKTIALLPALTGIFYLSGIRPTTDYVHLVPLLSLACLPLALIVVFAKKKLVRYGGITILICLTLLGFYTAYFKGYHQWDPSLRETTAFVSNERMKIYLSPHQKEEADALISYVQKYTKENDYVFVNYYSPMVYFITDRKNPTPYDFISSNQLPQTHQEHIVRTLQQKHVKLVVMHGLNRNENSFISNYVRKHYYQDAIIGGFVLLRKVE